MRKFILSLGVLALASGLALAAEPAKKKLAVGDKAPSFDGIPAVMGSEPASLSLSDIKEDVIVLVFLNNECPMVTRYEDRIIDTANAFKGKSVKFVGVAVAEMEEAKLPAIKTRVKEKGYNYVYGYDESGDIARNYSAVATPEFYVIDKDRVVRYIGALDDSNTEADVKTNYVKDAVNAVLSGKEVKTTSTKPRGCGINLSKKK